jgi:hypothetical protein
MSCATIFGTCFHGTSEQRFFIRRLVPFEVKSLDLNLPVRRGESPVSGGGVKLLKQMSRGNNGIRRPIAVVGVTAFQELASDADAMFRLHEWALLTSTENDSSWQEGLAHVGEHLRSIKRRLLSSSVESIDVLILTALVEVELEAVLSNPGGNEEDTVARGAFRLYRASPRFGGRALGVVACSCPEMGNASHATPGDR